MTTTSRRGLLRLAAAAPALGFHHLRAAGKATDVRIVEIRPSYEDYLYRTPIKFGGTVLDRVTLLNVNSVVETAGGKRAKGFGS
ncbi:MAG: hypothetical protein NT090_04680, partial [Acidobacteria bacterium]|nr:hypothetical protein [Acidobacteriota bacterium]